MNRRRKFILKNWEVRLSEGQRPSFEGLYLKYTTFFYTTQDLEIQKRLKASLISHDFKQAVTVPTAGEA